MRGNARDFFGNLLHTRVQVIETSNIGKSVPIMINEQVQDQIKSIDNRLLHMWRYL